MRLLVAGGAGYVGSVLIPKLLDRGYKVDVVDLFWFGNHLPEQTGILKKDIFHLSAEDLRPYEQVIFLAGLSNDPMAEYSPSKNFVFNAAAPAYLAYIAKAAGVKRCIYASSCSVYGYTENELFDETRPVSSSYPYGISKLQGEQAVMQLADSKFSVISLRKGTISGYSPRMRFDLIVNTMFKSAMKDGVININNPSIWRPLLSIEDAATAYTRAVEANPQLVGNLQRSLRQLHGWRGGRSCAHGHRGAPRTASQGPDPAHPGLPQLQSEHGEGPQRPELPCQGRREVHRRTSDRQYGQVPRLGQSDVLQHRRVQAA